MGKRSNFDRLARDSYDTPYDAVIPLLEHLSDNTEFIETCAGKNALIGHLTQHGHKCLYASDIYPRHDNIATQCVFDRPFHPKGLIITNPPWDRKILHAFIEKVVAEDRIAWIRRNPGWPRCSSPKSSITGFCGICGPTAPKKPPEGNRIVAFHGDPRSNAMIPDKVWFWDRFPHMGWGQVTWVRDYWVAHSGRMPPFE